MSKQSDAKKLQNYRKTPDCCGNCTYYSSRIDNKSYKGFSETYTWAEEKDKRCTLGGFATGKSAMCDRHEHKQVEAVIAGVKGGQS